MLFRLAFSSFSGLSLGKYNTATVGRALSTCRKMNFWVATTIEDPDSAKTDPLEAEKSRMYLEHLKSFLGADALCIRKVRAKFFWNNKVDEADELRLEASFEDSSRIKIWSEEFLKHHPYETPMVLTHTEPAANEEVVQFRVSLSKEETLSQKVEVLVAKLIGARRVACIQEESVSSEGQILFVKTSGALARHVEAELRSLGGNVDRESVEANEGYAKWVLHETEKGEADL